MKYKFNIQLERNNLIVSTGEVAKQADGSVVVQYGGTVVLVTCVCSKEVREGIDFLPLSVEYQEKTYAAGKIPGGFFKREGRPSEKEILTARRIDRPIRPLFPKNMVNDIQIIALVLSSDGENDSDILAVNGASCALMISDIPFNGPVGCVRVGYIDNKFVLNPTFQELEKSTLDLIVAGLEEKVIMVEAGSSELREDVVLGGIEFAQKYIKEIIKLQDEIVKQFGKAKRTDIIIRKVRDEVYKQISELAYNRLLEINKLPLKEKRQEARSILSKEIKNSILEKDETVEEWEIHMAISSIEKGIVRNFILDNQKRLDGRNPDNIRLIECKAGFLPRTHGSGLFTRGQTQALCVTTLGTRSDQQLIEALEGETQKSFMLHYNFPPFSVGEVSPIRGPGRREIGHGALAERALKPVMPPREKFPYTVRIVSDILESNGSTSMATVCAGSLSLMDAGVPVKAAVSGIAIGLIFEKDKNILLTDIAGIEDFYGDMDFKVAGTKNGITAIQLDLKIQGIDMHLLRAALEKARIARLKILDTMDGVISKPRDNISIYAPKIETIKIDTGKIKDIIGPGGSTIRKIIKETGVTIDIEDDGTVLVSSPDKEATDKAIQMLGSITSEPEIGKVYLGRITRILPFGALCEIQPGKEGLIHVSELANRFIKDISKELKVGQEVLVKVIDIDAQGKINLSRKQVVEVGNETYKNKGKEKRRRQGSAPS